MLSKETIRAYCLTTAAVEVLEEAGVSDAGVDEDFVNLGDGTALLDSCLACSDDDSVEGWCEYVACLVAASPNHPNHTVEERRAINARWTIAAPDMLEALEELCLTFEAIVGGELITAKARAAIKKARGEE